MYYNYSGVRKDHEDPEVMAQDGVWVSTYKGKRVQKHGDLR